MHLNFETNIYNNKNFTDLCGESTDDLSVIQIISQYMVYASIECSLRGHVKILLASGANGTLQRVVHFYTNKF